MFFNEGYSATTLDNVNSNCALAPVGSLPELSFPGAPGVTYTVTEGTGMPGLCSEGGVLNPGCALVEVVVPTSTVCQMGQSSACAYGGPAGTEGVGICQAGTDYCIDYGTAWSGCVGEVVPAAEDLCITTFDDDCDGQTDDCEVCGDGYASPSEPCDDGDLDDTDDCTTSCEPEPPPAEPVLQLSFSQIKRFDFSWAEVVEADYYQVLESAAPGEPFVALEDFIVAGQVAVSRELPLHLRWEASYVLRACNTGGCTDSVAVDVVGSLAEAVGYFKASNTGAGDVLGQEAALSEDGNTLVVGARLEASNATGINPGPAAEADDSAMNAGAAYVFVRDGLGTWSQQAFIKASNTEMGDQLGRSVALSGDGNVLAVSAPGEDGNATGIDGNEADNSFVNAGAAYVFVRDGMGTWSQQAYIKASNPEANDEFGKAVALSTDGNTLAVGTSLEDSNATGINPGPAAEANSSAPDAGAVYVFVRDGMGAWSQQAYVKASNTGAGDEFGLGVALSGDGNTLAVNAEQEDGDADGINPGPAAEADDSALDAGAVYVFVRDGMGTWSQQAYVKASNSEADDRFGGRSSLSGDGNTLAVSAYQEDGNANSALDAGAIYVFVRDGMGTWSQQAYVTASNTEAGDRLNSVALSEDGNTLAVGAVGDDSNATGIDGDPLDGSASLSGATYVFVRDGMGTWSQRAYVKASNTGASDRFGARVMLSGDGTTLAVTAHFEDSNATGVGGSTGNDLAADSGAVYLY